MLMPKKTRVAIYEYLFTEGVIVAEHNFEIEHPKVKVPNLHVVKALQTLQSKGLVKENYAWRHHYWYLTNEGVEYLRDFLHLPPEIVPSTWKKPTRPDAGRAKKSDSSKPSGEAAPESDRRDYRRAPQGDKKADAGAGAGNFELKGGFGRGKKPQTE